MAAQPLEAATASRRDGDVGVAAHAVALRDAGRRFGVGVRVPGLDAVAQASPSLAGVGPTRCGREARSIQAVSAPWTGIEHRPRKIHVVT